MSRWRRQSKRVQNWFSDTIDYTTINAITLKMIFINSRNADWSIAFYDHAIN